jgi:hypothetical protein
MVSGQKVKVYELKLEAEGGATEILGAKFLPLITNKGVADT